MFKFKALFFACLFTYFLNIGGAFSTDCILSETYYGTASDQAGIYGASDITGCSEYTMKYQNFYSQVNGYRYYRYRTCTKCKSGYYLETVTGQTMPDGNTGGRCSYEYGACRARKTCSDCESSNWATYNNIYKRKVIASCDTTTGTCTKDIYYMCEAGYYGSPTSTSSGCTKCPDASDVFTNSTLTNLAATTSVAGTRTASYCYLPDGDYYNKVGRFTQTCTIPRGASPLLSWGGIWGNIAAATFDWGNAYIYAYCASKSNVKPTTQEEGPYKYCICVTEDGKYAAAGFYSSSSTSCTVSSCKEDCHTKIESDVAFRIKLFD